MVRVQQGIYKPVSVTIQWYREVSQTWGHRLGSTPPAPPPRLGTCLAFWPRVGFLIHRQTSSEHNDTRFVLIVALLPCFLSTQPAGVFFLPTEKSGPMLRYTTGYLILRG